MQPSTIHSSQLTKSVLDRVTRAITCNRLPGFHLSGYLLAPVYEKISPTDSIVSLEGGPHIESDGVLDPVSLCFLADIALEAAARSSVGYGVSLATVGLHLQFTGATLQAPLRASSSFHGLMVDVMRPQPVASLIMSSNGREVCIGSATFMVIERPGGVPEATPPAIETGHIDAPNHDPGTDFSSEECELLQHASKNLRTLERAGGSFLQLFWGFRVRKVASGASAQMRTGIQVANRIGVVHGGILVAFAQTTARAALPTGWTPASMDISFIGPGLGPELKASAKIIHQGRTTAVLRVEVRGDDRRRVLEVLAIFVRQVI